MIYQAACSFVSSVTPSTGGDVLYCLYPLRCIRLEIDSGLDSAQGLSGKNHAHDMIVCFEVVGSVVMWSWLMKDTPSHSICITSTVTSTKQNFLAILVGATVTDSIKNSPQLWQHLRSGNSRHVEIHDTSIASD